MAMAEKVADLYVALQQEIFGMLIDTIKGVRPRLTDLKAEEMVEWRLKINRLRSQKRLIL